MVAPDSDAALVSFMACLPIDLSGLLTAPVRPVGGVGGFPFPKGRVKNAAKSGTGANPPADMMTDMGGSK